MTEKFKNAYQATMKNEGGYANDPNDHGGETWRGIARNFWGSWAGWKIVDGIKSQKPASLNAALSASAPLAGLVLDFYKQNFWDPLKLDLVDSNQISLQLFDISVNAGTARGAKMLQGAVNHFRAGNPIAVDGKIGPATIGAANAIGHEALYNQINTLRAAFYEDIIRRDPTQERFRKSWFSRIGVFKAGNDTVVA
jgi:lysozyme family protein